MEIRQALVADLDAVADLRLRFLAEHRDVEPSHFPADFHATTIEFLRRQSDAGTAISWVAELEDLTVGVVTMLLLDLAPRPEDESGREGYIVNMYVSPAQRRRGIGQALLEACLATARELPLRRVLLYATDDGRPLYDGMGFAPNPAWMGNFGSELACPRSQATRVMIRALRSRTTFPGSCAASPSPAPR